MASSFYTLVVQKGDQTITYKTCYYNRNWTYNNSNNVETISGPVISANPVIAVGGWGFNRVGTTDFGAYERHVSGNETIYIESTMGTRDNYPLYIWEHDNVKYYTPFVHKDWLLSNTSSITTTLEGSYDNLYLTLACSGKVFFFNYKNVDMFVNQSIKILFNDLQNVKVNDEWGFPYPDTVMTAQKAVLECAPSLLWEYQTVCWGNIYHNVHPSWRVFKTLSNGSFSSKKRIACVNINAINSDGNGRYYIRYYQTAECSHRSTSDAYWNESINPACLDYYRQNTIYDIDGNYHYISIPNHTPDSGVNSGTVSYVAYQNETQEASKIQFYSKILTYAKNTVTDTMIVKNHPTCHLYLSSRDLKFEGDRNEWSSFYAKYWTLTISKDNYVLADYNSSLGNGYERIGGRSIWHISSPVTQYTGVQKGISYTLFGPTGSSLTTYSVPSSVMGGGFYFQLGTYANGSTNKTGIWLRGRSTSGSDSSFGLIYETSLSSFRVGYHESEDMFSWNSITTNFSWINNHFGDSNRMIYYKQGETLYHNQYLVSSAFQNTFTNGTYYVTFTYNDKYETGGQGSSSTGARYIQTYELVIDSNGYISSLTPSNINT